MIRVIYPKEIDQDQKGPRIIPAQRKVNKTGKKKKRSFNFLYWFVVIILAAWLIYLNITVFIEYETVRDEYTKVKEEYDEKKEILNQKIEEFERLKKRVDEYDE
jgi:hypothetical protein